MMSHTILVPLLLTMNRFHTTKIVFVFLLLNFFEKVNASLDKWLDFHIFTGSFFSELPAGSLRTLKKNNNRKMVKHGRNHDNNLRRSIKLKLHHYNFFTVFNFDSYE